MFDRILRSLLGQEEKQTYGPQLPGNPQQYQQQQGMPQQTFQTPPEWLALTMHNSGQSWSDTLTKAAAITQNQQKVDNENYEMQMKQQQMLAEQQRAQMLAAEFNKAGSPSLERLLQLTDPKHPEQAAALYSAYNEYAQKQNIKQNLPNAIRELEGKNSNEIFATLVDQGVEANKASQIASDLTREKREKQNANQFTGADNIRYETYKDENGNVIARPIPGQIDKRRPELTPAEMRVNAIKLKELDNAASGASQELRLVADMEKYFKEFDEATGIGSNVGAGGIASKLTPKWGENIIWNEKAQAAAQEISKASSQLFESRVKSGGQGLSHVSAQEELKKSMPSVELRPEARNNLLQTKKREILSNLLRSKFVHEWSKLNHKDLAGAEDAFTSFIDTAPLLKENGEINKELIKNIPNIVKDYFKEEDLETSQNTMSNKSTDTSVPAFTPNDYEDVENAGLDLSEFENVPREVLDAEAARRKKLKMGKK